MKNTILIFVIICYSLIVNAQSSMPINSLNIAVFVPQSKLLYESNNEKLKSKMVQFLTKSGFGSDDESSASFMIYPKMDIENDIQLDAGLEPQKMITAEITFIIKQIPENKVFGSATLKVKGVGKNNNEAIRNCLTSINSSSPVLVDFVKIFYNYSLLDYYKLIRCLLMGLLSIYLLKFAHKNYLILLKSFLHLKEKNFYATPA